MLECCREYSKFDSNLWVQALTFFSKLADKKFDCEKYIKICIDEGIKKNNLLSPLLVLNTLCNNKNLKYSVIKDYLIESVES